MEGCRRWRRLGGDWRVGRRASAAGGVHREPRGALATHVAQKELGPFPFPRRACVRPTPTPNDLCRVPCSPCRRTCARCSRTGRTSRRCTGSSCRTGKSGSRSLSSWARRGPPPPPPPRAAQQDEPPRTVGGWMCFATHQNDGLTFARAVPARDATQRRAKLHLRREAAGLLRHGREARRLPRASSDRCADDCVP